MKKLNAQLALVSARIIERRIVTVRGEKVLLDSDLAELYGVPTKQFNRAVNRNLNRFPGDFMFRLNKKETDSLRFQIGTLETGRGKHRKYLPYVFTEQGVAMLSGVLNSKRAVSVNYDKNFAIVFDAIRALMTPSEPKHRRKIGFDTKK